jgi:hypothetical protein
MNGRLLILGFAVLATAPADAAELYFKRTGNIATYYMDLAEPTALNSANLNGQIDTISFVFTPAPGVELGSVIGVSNKPAGEALTYRNSALSDDPLDGGLGWSILGQMVAADTFKFDGSPLGQTIDTSGQPDGRLFLANMLFFPANAASPGTATLQLLRAGNIVANLVPTPEPAAGVLSLFAAMFIRTMRGRVNHSSLAA